MYSILKHPDYPITTVIKNSDPAYPSYIVKGYKVIYSGMKFDVEKKQIELEEEIVGIKKKSDK